MSKAAQQEEKQHRAIEKAEARQSQTIEGIYVIDPDDTEFKDTMKNARKKLEIPIDSDMPCKVENLGHGKTCGENKPNTRRSKYAYIVEAHESTRKRIRKTQQKDHEDHIAGKGFNSLSHYNLVHKFIPLHHAMKIPDARAAVDKEWEKLIKLPAWQMTKISSNKEVIQEAQREKKKVHFATLMDICHLKNAESEPKYQEYKGRVVL